jgi:hypothetical protein
MSGKLRIIITIIVLTILVLFAAFVWPTIYRYDRFFQTVVRTNRFSGESEALTPNGWNTMRREPPAPAIAPAPEKSLHVPPEDLPDNLKQSGQKPLKPITEYSDEELYKAAGIKPQKKSAK